MTAVHFTYRDNIFNDYIGRRVRVIVRNRNKKSLVFIGTFKAFDYHVNVVLADAYRVILFSQEEQSMVVDGLLLIRGVNVRCITFEERELPLPPWPTRPVTSRRKRAGKLRKVKQEKEDSSKLSAPTTPSKPVKLKRSWLTTPATSTPVRATSSLECPGSSAEQTLVLVKQEVPDDAEIPVKVKEEVKEEVSDYERGDSLVKSFQNLVTSNANDDQENDPLGGGGEMDIKEQPLYTSDMSTSS